MGSTARAFNLRDLSQHGKAEISRYNVNFGKVLPASATGNLFTVTGSIVVHGLIGVVSTIFAATNVSPTLGYTNQPTALAAAPAAPYNATAVGSVIEMPPTLGGALPAAVVASGTAVAAAGFVLSNTTITITTAATNAGAVTWLLLWEPLIPKLLSTTAVVNN
jgi:hypothetical protein